MSKLALAISIAAKAFENKTDKSGVPYILHCLWVMNNINSKEEDVKIAAVLHDLIEDCPDEYSFTKLTQLGFSDKTVGILHLLTHIKETPYDEYIKSIAVSKDATDIKLADLRHNSDVTRLKGLRKKDIDRIEKYHRAYIYLSN
jgi:(p)ppGpp synthase/HD superfamily hydrolase